MTDTIETPIAVIKERESAPLALDYAHRLPPRFPKLNALWRGFIDLGPVFPRPSILTLVLLLLAAGAGRWLTDRPQPWQLITSYNTSQANGGYPSLLYLPKLDAIASSDGNGGLKIWRPFTGETLLTTETPPAALPPNPRPGRAGDYWQLTASADESKILAKCDLGDFIWDAHTGQLIGSLSTSYLGPEFGKLPFSNMGTFSPDGSRLAVVNEDQDLLLYDITDSAKPRLLARQHLNRPTRPNDPTPDMLTFGVFFNPTGTHLLVLTDTMIWIGDATTLQQREYLTPEYAYPMASEFKFLHGGDRLLIIYRGFEVRLYDLPTMKILRRWPLPHNPSAMAVSPDEQHAYLGQSEQASIVLNLNDDTGRIERLAPPQTWLYAQPVFFPDNRRVVVSEVWRYLLGVVDTQTGRQVALISNPPGDWVGRQMLISRDGKKIAAMGARQVHVYEQVGDESVLGIAATATFWGLALAIGLLAASLSRDALRTRRRWGRTRPFPRGRVLLAMLMMAAGAAAMVCPIVWGVVEWRLLDKEMWWFDGGWLVWLTILHLFAGLGLLMQSRAWTLLTALLMLADIVVAIIFARYSPGFALHPTRIFDRMWLLPAGGMLAANVIWALLAAAALISLLPIRPRRVHS